MWSCDHQLTHLHDDGRRFLDLGGRSHGRDRFLLVGDVSVFRLVKVIPERFNHGGTLQKEAILRSRAIVRSSIERATKRQIGDHRVLMARDKDQRNMILQLGERNRMLHWLDTGIWLVDLKLGVNSANEISESNSGLLDSVIWLVDLKLWVNLSN